MSGYSMSAYDLASALYEKTNTVGIPLHERPRVVQDAWLASALFKIASGAVSMDDIATVVAH